MPDLGLIFDVDGVIADTEAVNARVSIRVLEEIAGIGGVRREDFDAGIGRGAEAYVRAAAAVHGVELTGDQVRRAVAAREEAFLADLARDPLRPFPGVLELMRAALDDRQWRVAIATSSSRAKSSAVLRSAGVPVEQMVYVNGDDVTRKKPDPQLFLLAAERLACAPASCVVVEDAPNGVAAARSAGACCVGVTNTVPREALAAADLVVDSLADVDLPALRSLFPDG